MTLRTRCLAVAAAFVVTVAPAFAGNRVLMIGDSWGTAGFFWDSVFAENGHPEITVVNGAIPGTKASDWAAQPDLLTNLLVAHPDVGWVIFSLGGNDLLAAWGGGDPEGWDEAVLDDYRDVINPALALRPDLRIVGVGYDFLNFEQSPACVLLALDTFDGLLTPQINAEFLRVSVAQSTVAADFSNVSAIGVWGALQAAGGIDPAPDLFLPSPASLFADCIHPNEAGYLAFNRAIYDAYFADQLDPVCTTDGDGDGFVSEVCGAVDCDDGDATVHPGAEEIENNGVDDDCNATTPDRPAPGCGGVGPGVGPWRTAPCLVGLVLVFRRRSRAARSH